MSAELCADNATDNTFANIALARSLQLPRRADLCRSEMLSNVDDSVALGLYGFAAAHTWVGVAAVNIANYGVFLLPLSLTAVWLAPGNGQPWRRRAVLGGCIAGVAAMCLGLLLERALGRPRPFVALGIVPLVPHAADSSFPSDHTLVGVALVGVLAMRV